MNTRSIFIIAICAILVAGLLFLNMKRGTQNEEIGVIPPQQIATTTHEERSSEKMPNATTTPPSPEKKQPEQLPEVLVSKTDFQYDIHVGTTPCNDIIGSFEVISTDPSQALDWTLAGTKPIWLTFSAVEGKTPATVDMTYNCILSGLEEDINWDFAVVETALNKEKENAGTYARTITLKGNIIK